MERSRSRGTPLKICRIHIFPTWRINHALGVSQAPIVHVCRGFPSPWKRLKCHPNRPRQIRPCNPGRYHSSDAERLRVHW